MPQTISFRSRKIVLHSAHIQVKKVFNWRIKLPFTKKYELNQWFIFEVRFRIKIHERFNQNNKIRNLVSVNQLNILKKKFRSYVGSDIGKLFSFKRRYKKYCLHVLNRTQNVPSEKSSQLRFWDVLRTSGTPRNYYNVSYASYFRGSLGNVPWKILRAKRRRSKAS